MSPKGRAGLNSKAPTRSKVIAEGTKKTLRERGSGGSLRDSCREILQPTTRGAGKDEVATIQKRQQGKFMEEQRE